MLTIKSYGVVLEKDQYTSSSKSHAWPPGLCRICCTVKVTRRYNFYPKMKGNY